MRQCVAIANGTTPRHLGMRLGEFGRNSEDVVTGLSDHFHIPNHGILGFDVDGKAGFIHACRKCLDAGNSLQDMPQKILDTQFGIQSVWASAITRARNDSGKARGVNTSTLMPSSSDTSN